MNVETKKRNARQHSCLMMLDIGSNMNHMVHVRMYCKRSPGPGGQCCSLTCLNFSTLIYYGFRVDTMHHDSGIHMLSQAPGFCNLLLSVYFAL